jgi:2-dehydropantoate 2-reductase
MPRRKVAKASAAGSSQGLRLGSLSKLAGATGDLREALLTGRELLPLVKARGIDLRRHRAVCCCSGHPPG